MKLRIFFKFFAVLLVFSISLGIVCSCSFSLKRRYTDYSFDYFDTVTSVIGFEVNKNSFDKTSRRIMSMISEYHKLFDIYHGYEGINNLYTINKEKGTAENPIKVSADLIEFLEFAIDCHEKTDGNVNIAMGSVLSLWHTERERAKANPNGARLPDADALSKAAEHTDISGIVINKEKSTVYLADANTLLDVGAIAKGYAVEKIAKALLAEGITGYVINVGGNVRTLGAMNDGSLWQVGVENPDKSNAEKPYVQTLALKGESLVTSGSYQRFYSVNGINYHHIIDKDTNYPAEGYLSVSVVANDSGIADALSTALFCVSVEQGREILSRFENTEVMWVLQDGSIRYSDGFAKYRA